MDSKAVGKREVAVCDPKCGCCKGWSENTLADVYGFGDAQNASQASRRKRQSYHYIDEVVSCLQLTGIVGASSSPGMACPEKPR